ncbi:hypothetical protein BSL78_27072 [Apostichopus japonicus]|uniref:Integrase catalytic domain-containing protein n=1 Tax=Stichopus japonicus TaxID=307972 RepID=A0A2G8JK14_STIJA|nr:hypothetical protein BSL78_27072 [Apostichopus japonicus]
METVGVDLFEYERKQFLLTVDYFTGFVWTHRLPNTRSETVVDKLDSIFTDFGQPTKLISDNGPQFTSEMMIQFCERHEINHVTSAPHHQQANGRAERNIQTVKNMLKKTDSTETSASLRNILTLLRDTPISSEIPSPYTLMFKRKVRTQLPIVHFSTEGEENIVETKKCHTAGYATYQQEPPPIDPETECWFKKEPNSNWQQAKVIEMQSDRKYTLQSHDGAQYQRNRIHVRPSPKLDSKGPSTGELSKPHSSFPTTTKSPEGKTTSPRATDDPYTARSETAILHQIQGFCHEMISVF